MVCRDPNRPTVSPEGLISEYAKEIEAIGRRYAGYGDSLEKQRVWSPFHEAESAHRIQQLHAFSSLMRRIGRLDLEGMKILDVGCGTGRLLRLFVDMTSLPDKLYGVDIREEALAHARKVSHPDIHYTLSDGHTLPFQDAEFDLVTQFVVFSSIGLDTLRRRLASEMVRVLKPGGYVFWWDMPVTVLAAGRERLNLDDLFPGLPRTEIRVGMMPRPSECLRPLKGLGRLIGFPLDLIGHKPTHIASLIRR